MSFRQLAGCGIGARPMESQFVSRAAAGRRRRGSRRRTRRARRCAGSAIASRPVHSTSSSACSTSCNNARRNCCGLFHASQASRSASLRASVAREVFRVSISAGRSISSIGSTVTPVASPRPCCARIVGIDDTLCRACRCRRVALWQRRVAAIVPVAPPGGPDMQANRISRIIRLGASRRRYRNRRDRQNRQSQHAHPNLPCSQTRPHSDNLCRRPNRSAVNRLA